MDTFASPRAVFRVGTWTLLPALLLAAACASSARLEHEPYVSFVRDASTPKGVSRSFTICYNPLTSENYQEKIDALVFGQCGEHVAPVDEKAASCTLLHPSSQKYVCLLKKTD